MRPLVLSCPLPRSLELIFHAEQEARLRAEYEILETNDEALAVHAYETWGFKNLPKEVIAVLNLWAEFVYAPLLEDRVRRIQETDGTMYGANVAEKVHRELRKLGGVRPPREFVLMDRAAIGLGGVFLRLRSRLNYFRLFNETIEGFDHATIAARQAAAFAAAGVPLPQGRA